MAFKYNLPIPLVVIVLLAAALGALVFFHSPPDEDLLRQAVDAYVATLGPVKQREQHGAVVDIIAGDHNRLIYALFEKKDGKWVYSKNLAEEFTAAMKDSEVQLAVKQHLTEKIGQRFQTNVTLSENLQTFRIDLARDVSSDELLGSCSVDFSYPKVGDNPQRSGLYVETFEWKDGKWRSRGPGSLYDAVPGARRP